MKIINKFQFAMGILNISLALVLVALTLCKTHTAYRYVIALICLLSGIMALIESIETEKQRQRKIAELQAKAKLYGWDKEQARNLTDGETEIYNSWLDSEAKDTGENILGGEQRTIDSVRCCGTCDKSIPLYLDTVLTGYCFCRLRNDDNKRLIFSDVCEDYKPKDGEQNERSGL